MKLIARLLAISSALIAINAQAAENPTIALVHGAFEDAHIWQGVEAGLKADGYKVITVNLPGRPGASPSAPDQVSLKLYRDTVLGAIGNVQQPVVLVGHSFGGITISEVAEAAPKKIRTLVYVAAYLPKDGDSLLTLATSDKDSKVGPHLQILKDKGIASIDYSARAELFANDGPAGLRSAIPNLILDEPLGPLATPVHLSASRFGSVDKVYVHTARDQVVSPALQAAMVTATPVRYAATLNTGHTPFLTDAPGLTAAIEQAAH